METHGKINENPSSNSVKYIILFHLIRAASHTYRPFVLMYIVFMKQCNKLFSVGFSRDFCFFSLCCVALTFVLFFFCHFLLVFRLVRCFIATFFFCYHWLFGRFCYFSFPLTIFRWDICLSNICLFLESEMAKCARLRWWNFFQSLANDMSLWKITYETLSITRIDPYKIQIPNRLWTDLLKLHQCMNVKTRPHIAIYFHAFFFASLRVLYARRMYFHTDFENGAMKRFVAIVFIWYQN